MLIEYKLLNLYGERFREEVIRLNKEDMKTEPTFAKILNLNGNPYEEYFLD